MNFIREGFRQLSYYTHTDIRHRHYIPHLFAGAQQINVLLYARWTCAIPYCYKPITDRPTDN